MAKQTWVNVDGSWRKVKTAWVNLAGLWKKVTPKGNIEGIWKDFLSTAFKIYELGTEYISIVEGFENAFVGSVEKNTDNFHIRYYDGRATAVTNSMIDLTNYSKVMVEWEHDTRSGSNIEANLYISTDKNADSYYQAKAKIAVLNGFNKMITELDISSIGGDHYVMVQGQSYGMNTQYLRVYRLWLE